MKYPAFKCDDNRCPYCTVYNIVINNTKLIKAFEGTDNIKINEIKEEVYTGIDAPMCTINKDVCYVPDNCRIYKVDKLINNLKKIKTLNEDNTKQLII